MFADALLKGKVL